MTASPDRLTASLRGHQVLAWDRGRDYVLPRMNPETPTVPLSRFRAVLAGPRGHRKLDALLSAQDPAAAVASVPIPDLYQLVDEVGLNEALDLLSLATPEQVRGCIDIVAWDQDQLQVTALVPWLHALVETGYENLGVVWEQLDTELTALTLQRLTRIYDLSQGEAPDEDEERPVLTTPDTFFALVLLPDDQATVDIIHRLVEDLYRADPDGILARHTLMAARSEPPAELQEMSYRWRAGRMADLGYVDFYEALEIFRPLAADTVTVGEGTEDRFGPQAAPDQDGSQDRSDTVGAMPAVVAAGVVGRGFLARALDRVTDPAELARLEMALVVLVNKVLSAARVSAGDQEALKAGAEHASASVALGLEAVSKGDQDRAVAALQTVSLTRLHRVGHTLTLPLARMARALAPRAVSAGEPDASMLAALCGRRPWFPRALDDDGGTGIRAFESMDDVRRVAEALTRLALRVAVADSLEVDLLALAAGPADAGPADAGPALDDHARTALLRAMAGGAFEATPLTMDELERFRRTALAGGTLTPQARDTAAAMLLGRLDQARVTAGRHLLPGLLAGWLADIEALLGPLPADQRPDPRFLAGLVLAASRS